MFKFYVIYIFDFFGAIVSKLWFKTLQIEVFSVLTKTHETVL